MPWRWWLLLPGLFLGIGGVTFLLGEVLDMRDVRDLWGVYEALDVEGVAGIVGATFTVSVLLSLPNGTRRKCPQCGKWWGRLARSSDSGTTTEQGGHFHASGFVRSETTTFHGREHLVCRRCGHDWSVAFAIKSRREGNIIKRKVSGTHHR